MRVYWCVASEDPTRLRYPSLTGGGSGVVVPQDWTNPLTRTRTNTADGRWTLLNTRASRSYTITPYTCTRTYAGDIKASVLRLQQLWEESVTRQRASAPPGPRAPGPQTWKKKTWLEEDANEREGADKLAKDKVSFLLPFLRETHSTFFL